MSAISTDINKIRNAVWADEVRESIAHGIEQCYSDVSNPTLQTDALEAALQAKIDEGEMAALTIGDGTITTSKIANGAITQAKLDPNISFEADDELDATSTNAIQNKVVAQAIGEVNESLGGVSESIVDRFIEFSPSYETVIGYYTKNGTEIALHSATSVIGSVVVTKKISCKPGYKYLYSGACSGSVVGAFFFNGNDCVSTYASSGSNKEYLIPDNVDGVIFQSFAAQNVTPTLSVSIISPTILDDIRGFRGGEIEQVWTKTLNRAEWANNPAKRTQAELNSFRKIEKLEKNGFTYSLYESGGHYIKNNKLGWLDFESVDGYMTDPIICYEGQQFLYRGTASGGNAFHGVFFLDSDAETVLSTEAPGTSKHIVTIPSGVSYVVFQSTWAKNNGTPYIYIEEYSIVKRLRRILPLNGIKMAIFGDSITMPSMSDYISYVDMLKNDGMEITNLARSGTGISVGYSTDSNYYGRIGLIPEDVQMIIVSGSFNDLNRGPNLGTIDDEGTSTIAGYMNQLFTELLNQFPTIPMLITTTGPWSGYYPGTQKSDDYVDMLREMGKKYGIPFYSIYDKTNLRPWINECKALFFRNNGDGVHPNTQGHKQMYALLRPVIEQMCYQTVVEDVPGK